MTLFGILFLIIFIACFLGAVAGAILDIPVLGICCACGIFVTVLIFVLIDKLIKKIKTNNVKKLGKQINAKVVGATFGGRKEVNIGRTHKETVYYTPIFVLEDYFGNKTYYTAIKSVTGEDLAKLSSIDEVKITVYKNYCVIDENLSFLSSSGTVPYMGKDIVLDEEGYWQAKKLDKKESNKQKHKTHTIVKVAVTVLSVISITVIGGAITLGVYGIISKQYSLIIGCGIAIIFTVLTDSKILFTLAKVLFVDKKGTPTYANAFTTDVVYSHSTEGGSTTNYIVRFSFYDAFGNIQNTEEYVIDEVYFRVQNLDRLPIKVYKTYAAINQDALYQ